MKIEHFFLMAGLGEVAHFDVDQLSDLLRKKAEWERDAQAYHQEQQGAKTAPN